VDLFVVGAGYVGLTTAVGFADLGHRVTVHDVDVGRVRDLSVGRPPIIEAGLEEALHSGLSAGLLRFTDKAAAPEGTQMAFVCVPTPGGPDELLDTGLVEAVVRRLLTELGPAGVIVVRSTLPLHGPDRLEHIAGEQAGPAIVVNPEFMREGRALADFAAPSRVSIGYLRPSDRAGAERLAELYAPVGAPLVMADARSTVLLKLAANVFLGLKVAFADELARLCDAIGADVSVVADGIGLDPRIGRAFLDSGPGFGGSCLPEQAAAIAVETTSRGMVAPLLGAVAASNRRHQSELVATIGRLLPEGLRGTRIALLGLAFKAGTNDVRFSPALALADELRAHGATVIGYDPVAASAAQRADPALETAPTPGAAAAGADAIVIATEWPEFADLEWPAMAAAMRGDLVYDTRRALRPAAVTAAGLRYRALGQAALAGSLGRSLVSPSRDA
jgi:UDPglucose 6-dehydrogenase